MEIYTYEQLLYNTDLAHLIHLWLCLLTYKPVSA